MKQTNKKVSGTSFHGIAFTATVGDLRKVLGEPTHETNNGEGKVNFEWEMETEDGEFFTVYDYKEYRRLEEDENVEWHIGGRDSLTTMKAAEELDEALASA